MSALCITRYTYFSHLLNNGIVDITMSKYEVITAILQKYGVTDIWDVVPENQKYDSMATLSEREAQIAERIAWGASQKRWLVTSEFLVIQWIIFFVKYIRNFILER